MRWLNAVRNQISRPVKLIKISCLPLRNREPQRVYLKLICSSRLGKLLFSFLQSWLKVSEMVSVSEAFDFEACSIPLTAQSFLWVFWLFRGFTLLIEVLYLVSKDSPLSWRVTPMNAWFWLLHHLEVSMGLKRMRVTLFLPGMRASLLRLLPHLTAKQLRRRLLLRKMRVCNLDNRTRWSNK